MSNEKKNKEDIKTKRKKDKDAASMLWNSACKSEFGEVVKNSAQIKASAGVDAQVEQSQMAYTGEPIIYPLAGFKLDSRIRQSFYISNVSSSSLCSAVQPYHLSFCDSSSTTSSIFIRLVVSTIHSLYFYTLFIFSVHLDFSHSSTIFVCIKFILNFLFSTRFYIELGRICDNYGTRAFILVFQ